MPLYSVLAAISTSFSPPEEKSAAHPQPKHGEDPAGKGRGEKRPQGCHGGQREGNDHQKQACDPGGQQPLNGLGGQIGPGPSPGLGQKGQGLSVDRQPAPPQEKGSQRERGGAPGGLLQGGSAGGELQQPQGQPPGTRGRAGKGPAVSPPGPRRAGPGRPGRRRGPHTRTPPAPR